jgi:hypothetical protein
MPVPAPGGPYTAFVECRRNSAGGGRTGRLYLPNNRQHVGREGVGIGALSLTALGARCGQIDRVAQLHALGLPGRQRGAGAIRDQVALFSRQAGGDQLGIAFYGWAASQTWFKTASARDAAIATIQSQMSCKAGLLRAARRPALPLPASGQTNSLT